MEKVDIEKIRNIVSHIGDLISKYDIDTDEFDNVFKSYLENCEDVELAMLVYNYYNTNIYEKKNPLG